MPLFRFRFATLRAARCLPAVVIAVSACGSESTEPPETSLTSPSGSTTGLPTDSTRTNTPNAFAGIRISPQSITIALDNSFAPAVHPVDERGIPSFAQVAGRPTWSVSNAAVASVSVDGVIRANAPGTTKVYAVLGTYKDSATVTVVATRDSVPATGGNNGGGNNGGGSGGRPDTTNYTPPAPVTSFNLSAYIFGRATPVAARDTAYVVQLGGASVSLYRLAPSTSSHSDSLGVRTLVQTLTANSHGRATFTNVSSGFYVVVATAMYEGNALEGSLQFGPPRESEYAVAVYLNKK